MTCSGVPEEAVGILCQAHIGQGIGKRFNARSHQRIAKLLSYIPHIGFKMLYCKRLFLLFVSVCACACCDFDGSHAHLDYVVHFHVKGKVFDKKTKGLLGKVEVFFEDTGYDFYAKKNPNSVKMGESDKEGNINIKYRYVYGVKPNSSTEDSFKIILKKTNYESRIFSFNESDLPKKEDIFVGSTNVVQADLNHIYLESLHN